MTLWRAMQVWFPVVGFGTEVVMIWGAYGALWLGWILLASALTFMLYQVLVDA